VLAVRRLGGWAVGRTRPGCITAATGDLAEAAWGVKHGVSSVVCGEGEGLDSEEKPGIFRR